MKYIFTTLLTLIFLDVTAQSLAHTSTEILNKYVERNPESLAYGQLIDNLISDDFKKIESLNSLEAYQSFVDAYETILNNHLVVLAKDRVEKIKFMTDYSVAKSKSTIESYNSFLSNYDGSDFINYPEFFEIERLMEARQIEISAEKLTKAYALALIDGSIESFESFLEEFKGQKESIEFKKIEKLKESIEKGFASKRFTGSDLKLEKALEKASKDFTDFVKNETIEIIDVGLEVTKTETPKLFDVSVLLIFKK
jgi:hypothetical protein